MIIEFLNGPDETVKWEALKSNIWSIESIDDPTEEMCIYAVDRAWNALKLIKNPSFEVIKRAVESKGWAIQYVENPPLELQLIAVKKDFDSIKYLKNPSEEVKIAAVAAEWSAIKFIDDPSLDIKRTAVRQNEESIRYIDDASEEELCLFLEDNIKSAKYMGGRVSQTKLEEVLIKKLGAKDVDRTYVIDFIECEAIELDKVKFIKNYGSILAKAILVDYKLNI